MGNPKNCARKPSRKRKRLEKEKPDCSKKKCDGEGRDVLRPVMEFEDRHSPQDQTKKSASEIKLGEIITTPVSHLNEHEKVSNSELG